MCTHVYTADYSLHQSRGRGCPYPAFFARLGEGDALPVDAKGACLFHSADAGWKRANDFGGRFLRLLRLLDEHDPGSPYDFAEFVFAGPDGTSPFTLSGMTLRSYALFLAARFVDPVLLEDVTFERGADFDGSTFEQPLEVRRTRMGSGGFDGVRFTQATFADVEFRGYAEFSGARFSGPAPTGRVAHFRAVQFSGPVLFADAVFDPKDHSSVRFEGVHFGEGADFQRTRFACPATFAGVAFCSEVDFIDTAFEGAPYAGRYAGIAGAEFLDVHLPPSGEIDFRSTDPARRLFGQSLEITFAGEPQGRVFFENVNLARLPPVSRDRLMDLERRGLVQIGRGCIKYRLQTGPRTVAAGGGNAALVVELCQTFATYFTAHQGVNLGFEIVTRDAAGITFFYYSDEDLDEDEFLARLARTERDLWNLLSIGSEAQLAALPATNAGGESAVVNAVDGLSALLGTFFRVGVRIAAGRWREADTRALLGAIRFNDGAELRAAALHHVLAERYSGTLLAELNRRQNTLLPRMHPMDHPERILFLAADPARSQIDLERELARIETDLRLAQGRERLHLTSVPAATVDRLMQAMLDESPTIVHFSGHGREEGIVLRREGQGAHVVDGEALAQLFKLFRDTVRCVVLNACWSEPQARAIRRHVPAVIGMRSRIEDDTAIAFSAGFYKAIAAAREVPFAFEMGRARAQADGARDVDLIVLL